MASVPKPAAPVDNDQLLANRLVKHMKSNEAPLSGWEWRLSCIRGNPRHYKRTCLIKALRADAMGMSGKRSLTDHIFGLVVDRLIREAMDGLTASEAAIDAATRKGRRCSRAGGCGG